MMDKKYFIEVLTITTDAIPTPVDRYKQFINQINTNKHELALRIYALIVLFHWAEHLVQAFQIFVLKWPRPESRGLLGHWFPWLVSSELMHYLYALFMLVGL